jgi:hypothetical protein
VESKLLADFLLFLADTQRWAERFISSPNVTQGERGAAQSLLRYIQASRTYATEPSAKPKELKRRRRKIDRAYWMLHLQWLESGRH